MNTFYFYEGTIYETEAEAKAAKKAMGMHGYSPIDEIKTNKSWTAFEAAYDKCKDKGNSCFDSIEWAR